MKFPKFPEFEKFGALSLTDTPWDGNRFHPLGYAGDVEVRLFDGTYYMYHTYNIFHEGEDGKESKWSPAIALAVSDDGISWRHYRSPSEEEPEAHLLIKPELEGDRSGGIETVSVAKAGNEYVMLAMVYPFGCFPITAGRPSALARYTASSPVGPFTYQGIVMAPTYDWHGPYFSDKYGNVQGGLAEPTLISNGTSLACMYAGNSMRDGRWQWQIGVSISRDAGKSWIDVIKPVFGPQDESAWDDGFTSHCSTISHPSMPGFLMAYAGGPRKGSKYRGKRGIGLAYSLDGITWERDPSGPCIVQGDEGDLDKTRVDRPCLLYKDGKLSCYYSGSVGEYQGHDVMLAQASLGDGE